MWLEQGEPPGGSSRPHCLEPPWEGDTIFDVQNIERSISEQQRSEEAGAERQALKDQV